MHQYSHDLQLEIKEADWPSLDQVGLSSELLELRREGVGGSDANIILSGDPDRIHKLWREKRGQADPEDLSSVLPVMLGSWTEAFNRQWYEQKFGLKVSRVGAVDHCQAHPWRRCTLDGYIQARDAVFEAKHVSAFAKPDEVLERYMPQLQHNMAVCKAPRAILSVIFGNQKWEAYEVASDWLYQEELLIAEVRFWDSVRIGEPPVPAAIPPVPKPVGFREACFDGSNVWGAAASDWLVNREPAKCHAAAAATLKGLVEDDVSRAFGHGIEIRRSKSGALTIREWKA